VTNRRAGGSIVDSRHDNCDVPNAPKDAGALRTTLVWLDRDEYAVGDHQKFEVRIENVGAVPVEMPFSPHLADLQPVMQAEVPIFGGEVGIWAPETKLVTICLKLRGR
jgi:hypothetical protein